MKLQQQYLKRAMSYSMVRSKSHANLLVFEEHFTNFALSMYVAINKLI